MKRLIEKLRRQTGETLVEVLIATLVASLSCAMLVTALTVSARINKNASDYNDKLYHEVSAAEKRVEGEDCAVYSGKITVDGREYDVTYYYYSGDGTGAEGKILSYSLEGSV